MALVSGDVVRARNGREAVVLLAHGADLTVLMIRPVRRVSRRSDVTLAGVAGLLTNRPMVRCEATAKLVADRVELVGVVPPTTLWRLAATYVRERRVQAAEDRMQYMRRRRDPFDCALEMAA